MKRLLSVCQKRNIWKLSTRAAACWSLRGCSCKMEITAHPRQLHTCRGQYLILTGSSGSQFCRFSQCAAVTSFPSLANGGERLRLLNAEGALLDEVNYSPNWHATAEKAAGGWSLERIDATQLCQEETNWTSSVAEAGGTPGTENSVAAANADVTAPQVLEVEVLSASSVLQIRFSEKMDTTSLKEVRNYQLQAPAAVQSVELLNNREVRLELSGLVAGAANVLTVAGVADCSGNQIENFTFSFGLGRQPQPGELVFTEILSDETPVVGLPETEYLEVTNLSSSLLELEGVQLQDGNIAALPSAATACRGRVLDTDRQQRRDCLPIQ